MIFLKVHMAIHETNATRMLIEARVYPSFPNGFVHSENSIEYCWGEQNEADNMWCKKHQVLFKDRPQMLALPKKMQFRWKSPSLWKNAWEIILNHTTMAEIDLDVQPKIM